MKTLHYSRHERTPTVLGVFNFTVTAILAAAGLLLLAAALIHGNSISYDLRWTIAIPLSIAGWLLVMLLTGWTDRKLCVILLSIAVSVVFESLAIDHLNLLVEHGIWCSRGMPDDWHFSW